jgi:hypothetical protein
VSTTPIPQPHPDYQPAPTRSLPDGTVEMDAGKWLGLLQTAAFFAKGRKL